MILDNTIYTWLLEFMKPYFKQNTLEIFSL